MNGEQMHYFCFGQDHLCLAMTIYGNCAINYTGVDR